MNVILYFKWKHYNEKILYFSGNRLTWTTMVCISYVMYTRCVALQPLTVSNLRAINITNSKDTV